MINILLITILITLITHDNLHKTRLNMITQLYIYQYIYLAIKYNNNGRQLNKYKLTDHNNSNFCEN